jgi:hypothetical protein
MVTARISLVNVVALAGALLSAACADGKPTTASAKSSELRGALVYLRDGGVRLYPESQSGPCVQIEVRIPEYGTQFETVQNAQVVIRNFVEAAPSSPCGRSIAVDSANDIIRRGEPLAFERQPFTDDLPEGEIEHLGEIRGTAAQLVNSIVEGDYSGFRSLLSRDQNLEELEKMRGTDPVRRRFDFMHNHSPQFFGAATKPAASQILVRRYARRQNATACVCRRGEGCKHSDTFDAPTMGSWGDAMFCFRLDQHDGGWKIADPIFR